MNILDKLSTILPGAYLGVMPDTPDTVTAIFEYESEPPKHSFDRTDISHGIQARTRAATSAQAYALAKTAQSTLNRFTDSEISVLQTTPILDIGVDEHNPPRHEYTINFLVRRLY